MLNALKVLLGFKVRTVQTFEPPGSNDKLVYLSKAVPVGYRLPVALRVLQNNSSMNCLEGLYAMQVLTSEDERRARMSARIR